MGLVPRPAPGAHRQRHDAQRKGERPLFPQLFVKGSPEGAPTACSGSCVLRWRGVPPLQALRVLAKLEHPRPPDMSDLAYHRWIDKLVTSKFEMVITPQTYGKNRDSKDVRLK